MRGLRLFCGAFFVTFMLAAGLTGVAGATRGGKFDEALPVTTPARDMWGRAEYALFRQGREGVVMGRDGWLFTAEEFSCPAGAEKNIDTHLAYVAEVAARLKAAGVRLVAVPVPAKARVYPAQLDRQLPACRHDLYERIAGFLRAHDIAYADVLPVLSGGAYLKTDTHWSPAGARAAAGEVAKALRGEDLPRMSFTLRPEVATHQGDLVRYVPGAPIAAERVEGFETEAQGGLLDDAVRPEVVLIGTSYSADRAWNFDGFLKQALQADVLNMAEKGEGPFSVMKSWLDTNPPMPRVVVWEMPERYFPL